MPKLTDTELNQIYVDPTESDMTGVEAWFSKIQPLLQSGVDKQTALSMVSVGGQPIYRACTITALTLLGIIEDLGGKASLTIIDDPSVGRRCPDLRNHVVIEVKTKDGWTILDVANGTVSKRDRALLLAPRLQEELVVNGMAKLLGKDNDGKAITFAEFQEKKALFDKRMEDLLGINPLEKAIRLYEVRAAFHSVPALF